MNWKRLFSTRRMRPSKRSPSPNDRRNEFESDLGRLLFSPALRRMHDKTQVFPLETDDNIHSRLSHSLEVQSLAYSLGVDICMNEAFLKYTNLNMPDILRELPVILSVAGLCHDIGNPPFGHYGEEVIRRYFVEQFKDYIKEYETISADQKQDFIYFDGNAQGFRILTKLQVLQDVNGLNLTLATLSAFIKYPIASGYVQHNRPINRGKIGVYYSENNILEAINKETELNGKRNPFSFLMEAADDMCNTIMDIEDGFNKGYYSFDDFYGELTGYIKNRNTTSTNIVNTLHSMDKIVKEVDEFKIEK